MKLIDKHVKLIREGTVAVFAGMITGGKTEDQACAVPMKIVMAIAIVMLTTNGELPDPEELSTYVYDEVMDGLTKLKEEMLPILPKGDEGAKQGLATVNHYIETGEIKLVDVSDEDEADDEG